MRIQDNDGQASELGDNLLHVADAHAGVEEKGLFFAHDQIGDNFFLLVRLVDGEEPGADAVDLKPLVRYVHALEFAVSRAWKLAAPLGLLLR